jgi:hypothetical protein
VGFGTWGLGHEEGRGKVLGGDREFMDWFRGSDWGTVEVEGGWFDVRGELCCAARQRGCIAQPQAIFSGNFVSCHFSMGGGYLLPIGSLKTP